MSFIIVHVPVPSDIESYSCMPDDTGEGIEYFDQHHFIRYIRPVWFTKAEYIKDGFADIEYFEGTHRLRLNGSKKLSFNIVLSNMFRKTCPSSSFFKFVKKEFKLSTSLIDIQILSPC